jgi:serine protease Do
MVSRTLEGSASGWFGLRRTPRHLVTGIIVGAVACTPPGSVDSETRPDDSSMSDALMDPAAVLANPHHHQETVADVAERVVPSIVNVFTTRRIPEELVPLPPPPFDHHEPGMFSGELTPQRIMHQSLGSGVIVSKDGIILTNSHVVEHAQEIQVMLNDGRRFLAVTAGADPMSDLAVLRLQGQPGELRPLPFGDSSALRLGGLVLAVGNPFGVGQTVTLGIVSAKGRSRIGIVDYEDFIQTDAAINPGNSGGALVNMRGELVGINTAILSRTGGSQGIGFAIPSDMAKPIMESLLQHGQVTRGWLGVDTQELDPGLAQGLGLPVETGLLVAYVTPSSPAEKAGLERRDVILELAGEAMHSTEQLRNSVAAATPGAHIDIAILRNGERQILSMTVGTLEREPPEKTGEPAPSGQPNGLRVTLLDEDARARFNIAEQAKGVVITAVEHGSRTQESGLRVGDVIQEIDRVPIDSVDMFEKALTASGDTAVLLVWRGARTRYFVLRRR